MRLFIPTVAAVFVAGGATMAEAPTSGRKPLIVDTLMSADRNSADQPIVFPGRDGHITAAVYEIAPGAVLPVHKHPFPRLGYVLGGSLRVTNVERGTSATYKSGDFVIEAVDVWHKGENIGPDVLRLLVIDLSQKGVPTTVLKK